MFLTDSFYFLWGCQNVLQWILPTRNLKIICDDTMTLYNVCADECGATTNWQKSTCLFFVYHYPNALVTVSWPVPAEDGQRTTMTGRPTDEQRTTTTKTGRTTDEQRKTTTRTGRTTDGRRTDRGRRRDGQRTGGGRRNDDNDDGTDDGWRTDSGR